MDKMIFAPDALQDRVVLVTGASRGIGAAILEGFAKTGAVVVGTATSEAGAAAIGAAVVAAGGRGKGIVLNVCDADACAKAIDDIVAEYGRIDVLVNNAGVTRDTLAMRMKDEQWDEVIDTDLTAAFRLARACLRPMMKQRFGRVISISSVVGAAGNPGQANYAAAKAGLVGMSKALAREMGARNITVNCVAPGFIDTDMTRVLPEAQKEALVKTIPLGRLGVTDDIANACLFLASDAGGYVTGTTLHVNGGMYMG
ncbi:3-oxoacyl-ACP reductase FabG [Sutterella megalosphaeroides]|uniref:3-oxoacyl-[acyl-carrier-protein] reductase n=1 Tax=Sutterella megalosphaeroides TaxID=2494234 RepID=A0A2Z6IDI0_9BURK|nr:3-oxoacyl-ACP reductase FabG [Sutterella megalosphaeroides]BBF24000.1 beta-ketoacyl-ACP reductase [Sutterella megalosphaeroides]